MPPPISAFPAARAPRPLRVSRFARPASLAAAFLAALACSGDEPSGDAIVMRDSAGIAIVENDLLRLDASCSLGPTPTLSIGEEEAGETFGEEYVLGNVAGATRLSDGTIVLANRGTHQLRYYGPDGRYVRSAGREGEGPGEFREPFYLHALPGDTVYAGDFRPFRFLVFDREGQWSRFVEPQPRMINTPASMNVLDDGRLVLAVEDPDDRSSTERFPMRRLTVQLHAKDGALTDTVARLDYGRYGMVVEGSNFYIFPFFESFGRVVARGDRIVIGHGSTRELIVRRASGGTPIERIVHWTGVSQEITDADVATERARERARFSRGTRPPSPAILESVAGEGRPVADRFPAFTRIGLGRDGRIWMREYQPPTDSSVWRWTAFSDEGRFECRVQTPRFADILEFGADYLLVLDEDSLGVERVKQFALSRP